MSKGNHGSAAAHCLSFAYHFSQLIPPRPGIERGEHGQAKCDAMMVRVLTGVAASFLQRRPGREAQRRVTGGKPSVRAMACGVGAEGRDRIETQLVSDNEDRATNFFEQIVAVIGRQKV